MLIIVLHLMLITNAHVNSGDEQKLDTTETLSHHQLLDAGITAFYQGRWDQARSLFLEVQKLDQNDPRPYFFEAMLPFWKYFFAGESEEDAQAFLRKSEKAISVGNEMMKKQPDDTTTVLLLSGLYGYRGLVAASERHYRTAMRSGANGFAFTRRLMTMGSSNPDALIGQGVFHYMMGSIPREARWFLSMTGLKGNRDVGFRKLEEASTLDSHTSTDARMILAYLYHQEERYEDALRISAPLIEKWPENIIFRYYYALSLEMSGHHEKAMEQYRFVVQNRHPELESIRTKSRDRLYSLVAMQQ